MFLLFNLNKKNLFLNKKFNIKIQENKTMKQQETWMDKIYREFFNCGISYSTSEDGERKIIWYCGPFSFVYNITKLEKSIFKIWEFKTKKSPDL